MKIQHIAWTGLIVIAGLALWLVLAGPGRLFGISTNLIGLYLLMAATAGLLYAVSRIPRDRLEEAATPAEWKARIGLVFTAAAIAYFMANVDAFKDAPLGHNTGARAIGTHLVMLLIAWLVLTSILSSRWKGTAEIDERDREIAAKASDWGRGALIVCIVGIAAVLGSPPERLAWATPPMIASMLIFALMWGWFCEYAATVAMYWRDRAQSA